MYWQGAGARWANMYWQGAGARWAKSVMYLAGELCRYKYRLLRNIKRELCRCKYWLLRNIHRVLYVHENTRSSVMSEQNTRCPQAWSCTQWKQAAYSNPNPNTHIPIRI